LIPRCCGLLLALACAFARAQEPVFQKVEFYISSNSRIKNLHHGVFNKEGQMVGSVPLAFKTSGTSDLYRYEGTMPIVFFEEEAKPTPENPLAVNRKPVARISLPPSAEQVLLLFTSLPKNSDSSDRYAMISVDLRTTTIPVGHISIFNFTQQNFYGAIGDKIKQGDPGVLEIVPGINRPVPIHPKGTVRLIFEFGNEDWVKVYENVSECDSGERLLLVIFPPRVSGSLNLSGKLFRFPDKDAAVNEEKAAEVEKGVENVEQAPSED
jgi:hypothetical protein